MKKNDKNITLKEFWRKNMLEISNRRGWVCTNKACPHRAADGECCRKCRHLALRCKTRSTINNYDRYIERVAVYLPGPMSGITMQNIIDTLAKIKKDRKGAKDSYSGETMESYRSAINVLFRLAQEKGIVYDIAHFDMEIHRAIKKLGIVSDRPMTAQERIYAVRQLGEKVREKPRSLTLWQQERLADCIAKEVSEDGRAIGVALALYCGLRPAEIRGLLWSDLLLFSDHPERRMIAIFKTRRKDGKLVYRVKTKNAYRKVPVHRELEKLIDQRLAIVREGVKGKDIGELPVCCYKNNFGEACTESMLATYAKALLGKLRLSAEELLPYYVDIQLDDADGDELQNLSLYVLRRNFWTWLASSTQLTDLEKRYVMGHEMKVNKLDMRLRYNNENRLWNILCGMDQCVISKKLHEEFITYPMAVGDCVRIENQGIVRVWVPKEAIVEGGVLFVDMSTEHSGEAVQMRVVEKPRGNFAMEASVDDLEPKKLYSRINCQFENWEAHKRALEREKIAEAEGAEENKKE